MLLSYTEAAITMHISECFFWHGIFMYNVDMYFFKHIDSLFYLIELIY